MRSFDSGARGALVLGLALSLALLSGHALADETDPEQTADAPAGDPDSGGADGSGDEEPAGASDADEAAGGAESDGGSADSAAAEPEDVPVNIRLRQLQHDVQGLKERAWRAKARVGMLKESVLGGGIGARASIVHEDEMGNAYRLVRLVYALDGAQIFARTGDDLHETDRFDILSGPIAPGNHTLSVHAVYKGHGYGVFRYLDKYTFTVRSSHTFSAAEGKGTVVRVRGYERGGATTPLEDRPAIDFKVTVADGHEDS